MCQLRIEEIKFVALVRGTNFGGLSFGGLKKCFAPREGLHSDVLSLTIKSVAIPFSNQTHYALLN
jgi:hypothetical protein